MKISSNERGVILGCYTGRNDRRQYPSAPLVPSEFFRPTAMNPSKKLQTVNRSNMFDTCLVGYSAELPWYGYTFLHHGLTTGAGGFVNSWGPRFRMYVIVITKAAPCFPGQKYYVRSWTLDSGWQSMRQIPPA